MVETLSSKPLYAQLKDVIVQRIVDGRWRVGEALPNESEIARDLGVSVGTVRRAVDELVAQGAIVRRQGKGSFILSHDSHEELCRFFPLVRPDGEKAIPSARLVSVETGPATEDEMVLFDEGEAEPSVHRLRRLRYFASKAVLVEVIVIPEARFPNLRSVLDFDKASELYALYQNYFGVTVVSADEHVRATTASEEDAAYLDAEPGAPLMTIDRIARQMDGRAVELRHVRCLADEFSYPSRIGAQPA